MTGVWAGEVKEWPVPVHSLYERRCGDWVSRGRVCGSLRGSLGEAGGSVRGSQPQRHESVPLLLYLWTESAISDMWVKLFTPEPSHSACPLLCRSGMLAADEPHARG